MTIAGSDAYAPPYPRFHRNTEPIRRFALDHKPIISLRPRDPESLIFATMRVSSRIRLMFEYIVRSLLRSILLTAGAAAQSRRGRAFDHTVWPVEIDEVYVSAGLKGHEHEQESRSRGLSTRGRGSYDGDKPPVFTLVDRGADERYVVPAKSAEESTVRLLLENHKQELLTVYTDGFRAYDPLEDDDSFTREYVVHADGEYADGEVHVNSCESHASLARRWLSPHRGVSKDKLTPYLRTFQLRRELYRNQVMKHSNMLSTPRSENQQRASQERCTF